MVEVGGVVLGVVVVVEAGVVLLLQRIPPFRMVEVCGVVLGMVVGGWLGWFGWFYHP